MRADSGQVGFSPTDLNGFLSCPHLTALDVAVALGAIERPFRHNAHAALIQRKGDEHEARYLASLRADGLLVVEPTDALAMEHAIREHAADVVYQARLEDDGWRHIRTTCISNTRPNPASSPCPAAANARTTWRRELCARFSGKRG